MPRVMRFVNKARVLIIDDSALIRQMLTEILAADPELEVVGTASDPYIAREKIKQLRPDVLTLDIEMPRMDGLTFLGNLMRLRPMPVVMISSLTAKGAEMTLQALALGAVDFVTKPSSDVAQEFEHFAHEIRYKVKTAARARIQDAAARTVKVRSPGNIAVFRPEGKIIAMGASTGGTEAIREVLTALPPDLPGIVVAQHIPEKFSASFAQRLNDMTALTVSEAVEGEHIFPGHAYIAPGGRHLLVVKDGARYACKLSDAPPVNRHRPSVDVLFDSVAAAAGAKAVGVILTGMGSDGAQGLKHMRTAGARTAAQDEKTSVVWGMPGEAVRREAAQVVLTLTDVAGWLVAEVQRT